MIFTTQYASYYDDLYEEKKYDEECLLIDNVIKKHMPNTEKTMVDLGCGTGTHAKIFTDMGYNVIGVDKSINMIKCAKEKYGDIEFINGDITKLKLKKPVDVAVSLFHVVSYLTTDEDLDNFLKCVYNNTNKNALLIFDVWCGYGVITDPPVKRKKHIKDSIHRVAYPTVDLEKQIVSIDYFIYGGKQTIRETHHMRYFFKRELKTILDKNGFRLINTTKLNPGTWNMFVVAIKK